MVFPIFMAVATRRSDRTPRLESRRVRSYIGDVTGRRRSVGAASARRTCSTDHDWECLPAKCGSRTGANLWTTKSPPTLGMSRAKSRSRLRAAI